MTRSKLATAAAQITVVVDGPQEPREVLVLAHGAGASLDSPFMDFFAEALSSDTRAVARFNFAYMEVGRKSPDRQEVSERTYAEVVDHLRSTVEPKRLLVGGKSYGGRIASHAVASGMQVDGLVFLGYPLHPPGRPDRIRDAHLYDIATPMLFLAGTRDPFCPLPTLEKVVANLIAPSEVAVIDDGDHSLKVRKSSGRDTEAAWSEAARAIDDWLSRT
ncbi:MAG: alpha/beta fold hydrolase [Actinomycetota bacterium]|nr:alpha/beta fold hydrolase [Actinomycetota bacterium]